MIDIVSSAAEEPAGRRRVVLRTLKAASAPMSIIALARKLGVHPNTVRFHLAALASDGLVEHVEPDRRGTGRPPLLFRAVRRMDRGGPRRYRLLAEIFAMGFAADPDPGGKALAAGRAWGRLTLPAGQRTNPIGTEESIDHLVGLLDELGFAPERRESEGEKQIGLRHCPFLELAETRSNIVCPIHLGLMQGALEAWEAPVAIDHLETFAEPDLCLAHLTVEEAAM